ncbi:MAG TPA: ABC-F family ATP-binding cassette domain-containing protein [Nannocystaceae bacterium]|nr:ABC-F family ATP-binding cassette domain-containing protein [Nannocystaceae bacterium]
MRRSYGTREVLRNASLSIAAHERVGLVGKNGAGKSTLARILVGEERPDEGRVIARNQLRVGWLEQEPRFAPGTTAIDAVLEGLGRWRDAIARHAEISARLERGEGELAGLLDAQARAGAEVEELGGWSVQHEAETMLDHMGVRATTRELATMSGGERRRVALARVLVAAPDLAILDEPTNHLDIDAVEWLEQWLSERFRGALVLVTHDRYLLDRVVGRTLEVEGGEVHAYEGGWASYLEAKAEREAHAERVEANRRNFLRRELEWLRRSPAARTTKQRARIDRAEAAIERAPARAERGVELAIEHVRSGNVVLEAENLSVARDERVLVRGLTLRLSAGERVGIVGPNGCGKTTLLQVLLEKLPPFAGSVRHGRNTRIAVLDQLRSGLDDTKTVFDAVAAERGEIVIGEQRFDGRQYLERFGFASHDQRKLIGTLSGGERARVALARILRDGANVIVLDEPTNDLDVDTLGSLEAMLIDYPGTVLVVTHDRWFLDRVATSILAFEGEGVVQYQGGYTDWAAKRAEALADAAALERAKEPAKPVAASPSPTSAKKLTWAEQRELEGLLEKVDAAEGEAVRLEAELAKPELYALPEAEQRAAFNRAKAARAHAVALADRWAELEAKSAG